MTQGSLALAELTTEALIEALKGRGWRLRSELAIVLGVHVRAIRQVASASRGAILSGNLGLKLTAEATQAEVDECLGRFSGQISEMTRRIIETRAAWEGRDAR